MNNSFLGGDGFGSMGGGMFQVSDLAWLMFMQSGAPGMYMLYSDLSDPSAQKSDTTLE